MPTTDPNPRADDLLEYFVRFAKEQPAVEEWAHGARLTRRWLDLMGAPTVKQTDVTELVRELEAFPDPGSGWFDLLIRVRYWARKSGLLEDA